MKRLLRLRYDVIGLVENRARPSFSDGSGFKELIIFVRKRSSSTGFVGGLDTETGGIYYYEGGDLRRVGTINLQRLPAFADRNWLSYLIMIRRVNSFRWLRRLWIMDYYVT